MNSIFDFSQSQNDLLRKKPLALIAGPCVIESRTHALETAFELKELAKRFEMPFIYKSSFDKANRTSLASFRGLGMDEGLTILSDVRECVGIPVLTDVHSVEQIIPAAEVVDILQIPAFLCRQTDLLLAAAATDKHINVKKGQFLAPWDMGNVIEKIKSVGNDKVSLCERGTTFGYGNLVVDMRGLKVMKDMQVPVIFDATHSVQLPGAMGQQSGGQREFIPALARAAVAVGIDGLFLEVHKNPQAAPCDGATMLSLRELPLLLEQVCAIDKEVKNTISFI